MLIRENVLTFTMDEISMLVAVVAAQNSEGPFYPSNRAKAVIAKAKTLNDFPHDDYYTIKVVRS